MLHRYALQRVLFVVLFLVILLAAGSATAEISVTPSTNAEGPTKIPPTVTAEMPAATTAAANTQASPAETMPPTETMAPAAMDLPPTPTSTPAPTTLPPLSGSGGRVIAYVSERDSVPGIYIKYADGSDQRRLTGGFDAHPDWSPGVLTRGLVLADVAERPLRDRKSAGERLQVAGGRKYV